VTSGAETGEVALWERAARGDEQAFARLVTLHKAGLYGYIRRFVGDADEAHDLLQQTLLSAWLAIDRYDVARPPDA